MDATERIMIAVVAVWLIAIAAMWVAPAKSQETYYNNQWGNYTNEVGKILRKHRKLDPVHNLADRPLHDDWADWPTPRRHR